jgi:diacylglycerol kinase
VAKDCGAAAVLVLSVGAVVVAAAMLLDALAG